MLITHTFLSLKKMPRKASKKIQVGNKVLTLGKNLFFMEASNDLYENGQFDQLRLKLEMDGYLFIRNVIPFDVCMNARKIMLNQANKEGSLNNYNGDDKYPRAFISKQLIVVYVFVFQI